MTGAGVDNRNRRRFEKGAIIASEGEESLGWFVLLSGRIGVLKKNIVVAEFAERGTIVGELSGILNKPRTATLTALECTEVAVIESGLDELITRHPDVTKKILVNLAERLAQTTDSLVTSVERSG